MLRLTLICACCLLPWALDAQTTSRSKPTSQPTTASQPAKPQPAGPANFGPFTLTPPKTWNVTVAPVAAGIRKAVYTLPRLETDNADGEMVVFFFKGGAGSVAANLARWRSQMKKPENLSEDEYCVFSKQTVDGLKVSIAEIRGDYSGDPRNPHKVVPNQMMLSAVVETAQGNYFIRTTGPVKTMESHQEAWLKMVLSIKARKKQ